ncbi:heparinase II/III family protein [Massilia niabensis]|uniref:Heparinase II/III-family protein n=1 Tax=Massilia niabensis TaxID=544910 RepID=A0ABW0L7A8_9BURK
MSLLLTKARTALALGIPNILRATAYSAGVRTGLNPVRRLRGEGPAGPFFAPSRLAPPDVAPVSGWQDSGMLFSRWPFAISDAPPDWLANPLTGQRMPDPHRPWYLIPDFDPAVGDIKLMWELSRMDWVLAFAQRARNGDQAALARLNTWLADWFANNPPYAGPNWKCGQEASIRVMHLAGAALVLGQVRDACPGLRSALQLHLQRIAPTVQYAMAQDNNHGTSEAAALYIGGSWLAALGVAGGAAYGRMGRRWLENRAARLIGTDGSFSQYSVNYHRVMLDTFCLVEVWRRQLALPELSPRLQARVLAAGEWLRHLTNAATGDAPNLGANDGARLLQLADTGYRDHRPSVQLALALFGNRRAYAPEGSWNNALRWLGVALPGSVAPMPGQQGGDDGGFAVLRRGAALTLLRYPRFRFRPSQADVLHLDLWVGAQNVLRDAGTYSYNTDPKWQQYFGGTAAHNTVQFDDRDQMPRLTRFLLGDWLKTRWKGRLQENGDGASFMAGYRDGQGANHKRGITLSESRLRVDDTLGGKFGKAVLRWRLAPGAWQLTVAGATARLINAQAGQALTVQAGMPLKRCELVEGWESRHYLEKTAVPVLELEVHEAGTLATEISWTS